MKNEKKNAVFHALVSATEKEVYMGGFGVSMANGAFAGGKVIEIREESESIFILFSYFANIVSGEIRGRMSYEMTFEKTPREKEMLRVVRHHGCIILVEDERSTLILYPDPEKVVATLPVS